MEKAFKLILPLLLQRIAIGIFIIFPIALSILSQLLLIVHSWDLIKSVLFGFLVTTFFIPIFAILAKNSIWESIEQSKHLAIFWVVGLALVLRIVLVQLISTDFVSDMEDVYFLSVDIYHGNPTANLQNYPNIPGATHLNMSALVLSYVYKLLGASTVSAKLFLIALGGLTTFLIYLTGREIADMQVGFLAAFLFAVLPSVICYTGVLAGDHLALPPIVLAIFIYARTLKLDADKFAPLILYYVMIGILMGLVDWFRPVGSVLIVALLISVLIYGTGKWKFYRLVIILGVLLLAYTQTSHLAVKISESIFKTEVLSGSQRMGEFILKGLNPDSKGIVTLEDDTIAHQTYQAFGNDNAGAQAYLIRLALSRLNPGNILNLLKEKFALIWASHDALFDYSMAGSNDIDLINLLKSFETLLYLVVTIFIFIHAIWSVREQPHPATFAMQMFILGFALLLLVMEVQNRYVMVVIPYSILLAVIGLQKAFTVGGKSALFQQ